MEMDRVIEKDGIIRNYFQDFIESEKFRLIIDEMRDEKISVAEINCGRHRVIIDDFCHSGNSDVFDEEELEAEECGKYFEIRIAINGDLTKKIGGYLLLG